MAKPKNLHAYDPRWEQLARAMLIKGPIIPFKVVLTRREALDIRQTFYGYRAALERAAKDPTYEDSRRQEISTLYTTTTAYQVHINPNPNNRANDEEIFSLKFIKQGATQPIKKFFDGMADILHDPIKERQAKSKPDSEETRDAEDLAQRYKDLMWGNQTPDDK